LRLSGASESRANEIHLLLVDAAVLESQRSGRIDPQNQRSVQLMVGTQRLVDESLVERQRRQEPPQHVVKRDVMVARHAEDVVTGIAQSLQKAACLLELPHACALCKIAADDDEVRPFLTDTGFDCSDQALVVRAEMEIGEV